MARTRGALSSIKSAYHGSGPVACLTNLSIHGFSTSFDQFVFGPQPTLMYFSFAFSLSMHVHTTMTSIWLKASSAVVYFSNGALDNHTFFITNRSIFTSVNINYSGQGTPRSGRFLYAEITRLDYLIRIGPGRSQTGSVRRRTPALFALNYFCSFLAISPSIIFVNDLDSASLRFDRIEIVSVINFSCLFMMCGWVMSECPRLSR